MSEKKTTVLVVDDDGFIRDVLASILEGGNYAVKTAENGKQAFTAFTADSEIGLIISDMNMPEMNGMELIAKIREKGSDVPVILLTADAGMTEASPALETGASAYLVKDENMQDVVILSVKKVLEKQSAKKRNIQVTRASH